MTLDKDPRDPRLRPYRGAAWAVYLVVAVGFSSLIIFSVFRSVLMMTPERLAAAGESLPEEACLRDARGLFAEVEQQRKLQAERADVSHSDQLFLQFRVEWLKRKRALESRCALEQRERMRDAFGLLDRVLDLYTTSSVQFSGGVGPAVDELKQHLQVVGSDKDKAQ